MYPVTSLLLLTFACCLTVTCVYFYIYKNTGNRTAIPTRSINAISVVLFTGLAAYLCLIYTRMFPAVQTSASIGAGLAICIIGFCYLLAAAYYQIKTYRHLDIRRSVLIAMLSLIAACSALGVFSDSIYSLDQSGWTLYAHLFLSLAAYAAVSISLLFTLLHVWQSQRVRSLSIESGILPSLEYLEKESFLWLGLGFGLLTAALLTGFFFLYDLRAQHLPHKVVLSVIAWLVLAVLLAGRHMLGWRGKTALKWVLSGFVLLFLAYFGSKFVLEVLLQRSWS